MDAGDYDTNTLLINNLSAISFRVYEPIASPTSYTFNGSVVEDALRNDGNLVYMDNVRHGIWCFYLTTPNPSFSTTPEDLGLHAERIKICGYDLGLVWEGNFKPTDLIRSRQLGTNTMNTPSSSSSTGPTLDFAPKGAQPFSLPTPSTVGNGVGSTDTKASPSPMADVKGYGSVSHSEIHRFFINAALSSLTTSFCRQVGAIALNQRTVLLPPEALSIEDTATASALANFRVYLTTAGSLVISLCVSIHKGLVSCNESLRSSYTIPGTPVVLAAPFGVFGVLHGVLGTDNQFADVGFGQSPDTQIGRLRPDSNERFTKWKTLVREVLQMRGMPPSILDGCSWLNVHFSNRKPHEQRTDGKNTPSSGPNAPWPAVLCFRKPKVEPYLDEAYERAILGLSMEHEDPLAIARSWDKEFPDIEEAIKLREQDREAALLREKAEAEGLNSHLNGYPPLTGRRLSNGESSMTEAGGTYPTPPDAASLQLGTAPLFDSEITSPGDPATNPPGDLDIEIQQHELEAQQQHDIQMTDTFSNGWEDTESKHEQATSNAFPEENIYGELGEDIFEGNQLTDADFDNFFGDENPGGLGLEPTIIPDIAPMVDVQLAVNQAPQEQPVRAASAVVKTETPPLQPQFTKPELKHARSILAEESRQHTNLENFNHNSAVGIKRHTSPFNPETVFKKIRASFRPAPPLKYTPNGSPQRRLGLYGRVEFDPSLSLAVKKYQESGPFNCNSPLPSSYMNGNPVTPGRILESAKQRRNLKELPSQLGFLLGLCQSKVNGIGYSPAGKDDTISDSDNTSYESDDDSGSDFSIHPSSPAKSSVMLRRRPEDDVMSMAASFKDLENISVDSPAYSAADLSRLSNFEMPDISLTKYFADPEPVPLRLHVSDDDFITVAQILTEQAASGTLKFASERLHSEIRDPRRSLIDAVRYSIDGLKSALPEALKFAEECQFRPFTEVQDVPLIRMPMKPADIPRSNFFALPVPHVEVRRNDHDLSVLPTAVTFWESLGLGPAKGPKDIVSVCIFPCGDGMNESASVFLGRIRSTYETLRLGTFDVLPPIGSLKSGLVPFTTIYQDTASPGLHLSAHHPQSSFAEHVSSLALSLASLSLAQKNFVIYFVYEPDNPGSIVLSCTAFQELFEHYRRCMMDRKKPIRNELVLQLVPFDLIASDTSVAVLSTSDCIRLCFESYDRCTLFGGPMPAPAIILEETLPRGIDFKLMATPSPNLLQENSYIHIAYAQSSDERWICAAWTDNRGSNQITASYCLGRRNRTLMRHPGEIFSEIWETTYDMISVTKVRWRIVITKAGIMDQHEADMWINLAQSEARIEVSLALMTVDSSPSLQLLPPPIKMSPYESTFFYTTPVSTPQPAITSPDQNGNGGPSTPGPSTPGGGDAGPPPPPSEPVPDETLVDVTDATWGVLASHRLNNSLSLTDVNQALASGYLLKRSGSRLEDPPALMELNVIYCDITLRVYPDYLLKEMMIYFRGLGTLARVRGMVDKENDVRPWHVAAVEKAVKVLSVLM
ncbi:mediator complex subunit 13 C-terminal-domain-containing protein [Podospora fimiseda]|uniref:Mediator of RNA polymerase II transcription subunit 13 n=1 Tax=Podospora fimiseda TaxID=252190 RepID=A0AAN7BTP2_9PEZI|nr:mediator complex subunit 13 C-terminal-domain-containing protein [Podospora fimiseda]